MVRYTQDYRSTSSSSSSSSSSSTSSTYSGSQMAYRLTITLQQRFSILAGLPSSSSSVSATCGFDNSRIVPLRSRRSRSGVVPRRLVLGFGAFFWAQLTGMNSKSFTASARAKGAVEQVLANVEWPEQFPFKEEDFQRFDESADTVFYESPRFVTHIDDSAIAALTKYYKEVFPPSNSPGVALLDMCSSWVSHFPAGYKQERIVGMGMNEEELKRNPVLTEYIVQDLNVDPKLPFEDNSFDVITNVVSVDYLTKPIEVFKEMRRVLKPGGQAIMSFSNRCFFTKAISIWTSTGDSDHIMIVGAYFHYAGGFEPPQGVDISPNPGRSDPMYIVHSRKLATA